MGKMIYHRQKFPIINEWWASGHVLCYTPTHSLHDYTLLYLGGNVCLCVLYKKVYYNTVSLYIHSMAAGGFHIIIRTHT